jgi:hypothetical protein
VSNRYCPTCHAEVEDTGGFCLLGHSLRLASPETTNSLAALRAEVDQAFEDARVKVGHALAEVPVQAVASPSAPSQTVATALLTSSAPPPPPPPVKLRIVEDHIDEGPDPIADFAPAPRMDWGPERQGFLKRLG